MQRVQRQKALENKTVYISCVIPVYNEEAVVKSFLTELHATLRKLTMQFEIIVIDDGSKDKTVAEVLSLSPEFKVKLLALSRNFGKEAAMTAGLEHCQGEVTILMDADFQHPVSVLATFLENWAEGYDMVYGLRQNRDSESALKRNFAHLFYWLMSKITHIEIPNNAGDFVYSISKWFLLLNNFRNVHVL